jgi:hypothetical protein
MLERLIAGGQTGVDRAALEAALSLGIACGGWCPRGRRAEDGVIAARYPLCETASAQYRHRTAKNVQAADATLLLTCGTLTGGTALTARLAERYGKPARSVDLNRPEPLSQVAAWVHENRVRVLNVAGPRESQCPGIHAQAFGYLRMLLAFLARDAAAPPANRRRCGA